MTWTPQDLELFAMKGVSVAEADRQIDQLRNGVAPTKVIAPCKSGNGIHVLNAAEQDRFRAIYEAQIGSKEVTKFVPASGAASRMFKHLFDPESNSVLWSDFQSQISHFAFYPKLKEKFGELNEKTTPQVWKEVVAFILDPSGLGYSNAPKGMVAFHLYEDGSRNAFEEHLHETLDLGKGKDGYRIHFTVGPGLAEEERAKISSMARSLGGAMASRFEVSFSEQSEATDTLALNQSGEPARNREGALLFRPGGHGSLIQNLGTVSGDVIFVKNIDNVMPDHRRDATVHCKKVLAGVLFEVVEERNALLASEANQEKRAFIEKWFSFGRALDISDQDLYAYLNRPIRVCGMVQNVGEPGGGPFWLKDVMGHESVQIVEKAQIDTSDKQQLELLGQSTHFNPVDLVCHMKDPQGRPYDLATYVNHERSIIAEKSNDGEVLQVIEHPGLWNGSMEGWLTIFVEVPLESFAPVKTVNDLLRKEHQ